MQPVKTVVQLPFNLEILEENCILNSPEIYLKIKLEILVEDNCSLSIDGLQLTIEIESGRIRLKPVIPEVQSQLHLKNLSFL
jgi:hypothetical protein